MGIRTKGKEIILRALLLCLCAVLAMGCACAEETESVNLGAGSKDMLAYGTTLADGRILMVGSRQVPGQAESEGWLLCLNRDRTVSWEYTDAARDEGVFHCAAELEDGTIGLVFWHVVDKEKAEYLLRFFTADGKPIAKEIRIPSRWDSMVPFNATKSRIQMSCMTEFAKAGDNQYRSVLIDGCLFDWEGNEVAVLKGYNFVSSSARMIEEADGLLMNGCSPNDNEACKTVLKTDLQGSPIWETRLERLWPDTTRADAECMIRTDDGGYLILQAEPVQPEEDTEWDYRCALVKLDHEGNVLWTRTEGFEGFTDRGRILAAADGKIAALFFQTGESSRPDNPRRIAWFDENGKFLGNVEMKFSTENFPGLSQFIGTPANEKEAFLSFYEDRIIPLEDGLWMSGRFYVDEYDSNHVLYMKECYSGLFKVPEL